MKTSLKAAGLVRFVALAACCAALLTAHAMDGGNAKSDVGLAIEDCTKNHPGGEKKAKRSECAKAVYLASELAAELKKDPECWPANNAGLLKISKCELVRLDLQKTALLVKPVAALAVTGGLLTENTSPVRSLPSGTSTTNTAGDATVISKIDLPVAAKSTAGVWSSGSLFALVTAILGLVVALGTSLYLLARRKAEVKELAIAKDAQRQTFLSEIKFLEKELLSTKDKYEKSQALRKSEHVARHNLNQSAVDDRSTFTRHDVRALKPQEPPRSVLPSKLDFEEAFSSAFRTLNSRNAPLPSGRELERVLANIENKQVSKILEERGLCGYQLLDSSGATSNLNPALFALQGNGDEWLIYPMPFAERTGMYRRWFEGFDDSKSMTTVRPACGTDRGGSIELTSKGQLA